MSDKCSQRETLAGFRAYRAGVMEASPSHAPPKTIAAKTIAWALVAVAVYDGAGFAFGGPSVTSSDSYVILRMVPGGMRTWGLLLLAGAVAVAWGIGREGQRGGSRALNRTLTVGVAYYAAWCFVLIGTWVLLGNIPAWGALSKPALLTLLYYMCARAVAPPHPRRRRPVRASQPAVSDASGYGDGKE